MFLKTPSRNAISPVCINISSPITKNPFLNDKDHINLDTHLFIVTMEGNSDVVFIRDVVVEWQEVSKIALS